MIEPTHNIKARKNGNCQRVLDLRAAGVPFAEISKRLGIPQKTARSYARHYAGADWRNYRGPEPRCTCGLLLPCTCVGGGLHAVDFMGRRGEPAPCSSGLRGSNAG